VDPERERIRLAELYSSLSDAQLVELAEDWGSLTDAAHQALKVELDRRRIRIAADDAVAPTEEDPGLSDPVAVAEFADLGEALLAKGLLESGGIRCALSDMSGNILNPNASFSRTTDGTGFIERAKDVKLLVGKADQDTALEALNQLASKDPASDDREVPGADIE
jgi:hypothetical protein